MIFCKDICIYDKLKNKTIIFGQSNRYVLTNVTIEGMDNSKIILVTDKEKTFHGLIQKTSFHFYIEIEGKISFIEKIKLYQGSKFTEYNNITLFFPFENHNLSLNKNSAIITTICKHYENRLEEWIQYSLKLGFSAIVIFNNDENTKNPINEAKLKEPIKKTKEICDKFKDKVLCIDFPYSPLGDDHWNQIQRITLHLGIHGFKDQCRNICTIDPDEFIYFPRKTDNNIEEFLSHYNTTIQIQSNILTNRGEYDNIDNNVLQIAKWIGPDKYKKLIYITSEVKHCQFIYSPHEVYINGTILEVNTIEKDVLIHYHCWINKRCKWDKKFKYFDILE